MLQKVSSFKSAIQNAGLDAYFLIYLFLMQEKWWKIRMQCNQTYSYYLMVHQRLTYYILAPCSKGSLPTHSRHSRLTVGVVGTPPRFCRGRACTFRWPLRLCGRVTHAWQVQGEIPNLGRHGGYVTCTRYRWPGTWRNWKSERGFRRLTLSSTHV